MPFTYEYPRPSVTLDAAVLTVRNDTFEILLIKRKNQPFQGSFALPGGFLEMDENPEVGAARELQEETTVSGLPLSPLFGAGKVGRDPRGRNLTFVYGALVPKERLSPKGGDDASEASWHPLFQPPAMGFDHTHILEEIGAHLKWQAATAVIGKDFLPVEFTTEELWKLHCTALGDCSLDSLLRRATGLDLIEPAAGKGFWKFTPVRKTYNDFSPLVW